jgi:transposase-like protein
MSDYVTMTVSTHCDLCGQSNSLTTPLRDSYATKDIKYVCNTCGKFADDQLDKLRSINHNWISKMLKLFLRNKRKQFNKRAISE